MTVQLQLKKPSFITKKELITYYKKDLDSNLYAIEKFLELLDFNLTKPTIATIIFHDEKSGTELEFTPIVLKNDENNHFNLSKIIKDDLLATTDNGLNKDVSLNYYTQIINDYENKKLEHESGTYELNFPELEKGSKETKGFSFPKKMAPKENKENHNSASISEKSPVSTAELLENQTKEQEERIALETVVRTQLEKEYLDVQKNLFTDNTELRQLNKQLQEQMKQLQIDNHETNQKNAFSNGFSFPSIEEFTNPFNEPYIERVVEETNVQFEEEQLLKKFSVDENLSVLDKVEAEFIKGRLNRQIIQSLKENYQGHVQVTVTRVKEQLLAKYSEIKSINEQEKVEKLDNYKNKQQNLQNAMSEDIKQTISEKQQTIDTQLSLLKQAHERQIQSLKSKLEEEYLQEEKKLNRMITIEIEEYKEKRLEKLESDLDDVKNAIATKYIEHTYATALTMRTQLLKQLGEQLRVESEKVLEALDNAVENVQNVVNTETEKLKNKAEIIIVEQESKQKIALEKEKIQRENKDIQSLQLLLNTSENELLETKQKYHELLNEMDKLREKSAENKQGKSFLDSFRK